jgi:hypothetical protein
MKITPTVAEKLKKFNDYKWSLATMSKMTGITSEAIKIFFAKEGIEIKHKRIFITIRDNKQFQNYDAGLSFNGSIKSK